MLRWFADIGCEWSAIGKLVYPARDNIGNDKSSRLESTAARRFRGLGVLR